MKVRKMRWAFLAAFALIGGITSSAFGIGAFQERFEWGDLSKPTKILARVAVVDPYDKAVWINAAVFGGNAESGFYWQKYFPGKSLKVYPANDQVWEQLVKLGKASHSQAVMTDTKPSNYGLAELVIQEKEQNYRVVLSVKPLPEVAGTPDQPRSIHSLRKISIEKAIAEDSWPNNRKMLYDVMIPGGIPIAGFIPHSVQEPISGPQDLP